MSLLKRAGWYSLGKGIGCLASALLLMLFIIFIFAVIAGLLGFKVGGIGALPGATLAAQIALLMCAIFVFFALLFLVLLIFGTFIDSLINFVGALISGGPTAFVQDWQNAVDGLLQGGPNGVREMWETLYEGWGGTIGDTETSRAIKDCPSQTDILLTFTDTHVERDYPFGKDGAEVQQDAVAAAESNALAGAEAALDAEIAAIECAEGCEKYVRSREVVLDAPAQVTMSAGTLWDAYEATATATGKAVIECCPPA